MSAGKKMHRPCAELHFMFLAIHVKKTKCPVVVERDKKELLSFVRVKFYVVGAETGIDSRASDRYACEKKKP